MTNPLRLPLATTAIVRVRAILLTENESLLLIKRVKPNGTEPYWVAPGGGVEDDDVNLLDTLERELREELGASAQFLRLAFVLEHRVAGKALREYFFICRLLDYDLGLRSGPEFDDPTRGQYILDEIPLDAEALSAINIKTSQLRDWLLRNLDYLRGLALS